MRNILIIVLSMLSGSALAMDTWTCTDMGSTVVCSGFQGGRYVTCTTTRMGSTSTTTCY